MFRQVEGGAPKEPEANHAAYGIPPGPRAPALGRLDSAAQPARRSWVLENREEAWGGATSEKARNTNNIQGSCLHAVGHRRSQPARTAAPPTQFPYTGAAERPHSAKTTA